MRRSYKLLFALLAAVLMMLLSTSALADTLRFGTVRGAATVNLRAGASTKTERIGVYEKGTWLRIIGEYGDWYRVKGPDGRTGYMSKNYVYMSSAAKGVIGVVKSKGNLNLRSSASWNGRIIGSYPEGVPCILLSESGDWYHVSVDGKAGYFNADYINKKYTTYSPDVATVATKNGGSLNLRKGPGKDYGVIKAFRNGSYVMVLQEGDGWWKVAADGYVGYMDAQYLKAGIAGMTGGSSGNDEPAQKPGSTEQIKPSGAYAEVANPGKNQKLFLRSSASKSSKSLGSYGNGTYVTVLEQGTVWCKVKVEGKTGYMMTEFLKFYGLSGSATALVTHPDRTFVYLRNGPSKSTGKVLLKVPHGSRVTVLTPGSTWSQVSYNGKTGYMMTRFLDD